MKTCFDLHSITAIMLKKGYVLFSNKKGHDLNIVGTRSWDMSSNEFNDWITVFYLSGQVWNFFIFPATTDPGTFYRQNPCNVKGTAVLKPGQYRGAYKIGYHKGYKALQQQKPVTVYRDANRDKILDTSGMKEDTGMFGINIHHANAYKVSTVVGKWSAGCQVFQDPDHFAFFMTLCERARKKFGNSFTYTLLQEDDLNQ
jgi:hypothetical protein